MTNSTLRTVELNENGLRFINFDECENKVVTIKLFPSQRLVVLPGEDQTTLIPHMTVPVINGVAKASGLTQFVKPAFETSGTQNFIAVTAELDDGSSQTGYYQTCEISAVNG